MEAGRRYKTTGTGWRRSKLPVLAAVMVLAAALLGSGCTRRTGSDDIPTETVEATVTEIPAKESSDKAPDTSAASTIESFPVAKPETEPGTIEEAEPESRWEKTAIVATDIHYLARSLTDGGGSFQYMVDHGDGKW